MRSNQVPGAGDRGAGVGEPQGGDGRGAAGAAQEPPHGDAQARAGGPGPLPAGRLRRLCGALPRPRNLSQFRQAVENNQYVIKVSEFLNGLGFIKALEFSNCISNPQL